MGNVENKNENLFPFEIIADIFELTEWEILSIIFNNNYFRFRPPSSFFPPCPCPNIAMCIVQWMWVIFISKWIMKIWSGVGRKKWNGEFHLKNMTWINLIIFFSSAVCRVFFILEKKTDIFPVFNNCKCSNKKIDFNKIKLQKHKPWPFFS